MTVKINKPAVNLREELNELKKPTGVAGEAMLRAETPQEQFNLLGAGRRNLLINGGFDVWQRGTSFTSYNQWTADRWRFSVSAVPTSNSITLSQENITNFLRWQCTMGSGGLGFLHHKIEGNPLAGKTATLSFKAKGIGTISDIQAVQYNNGGSSLVSMTENLVLNSSLTEYKFSFSLPAVASAPLSTDHTRINFFTSGSVSSVDLYITDVQVELGKVATPFEHRSYGEELALCQRYYEEIDDVNNHHRLNGVAWSATNTNITVPYLVEKRANPTVTIGSAGQIYKSGNWTTATGSSVIGAGVRGCTIDIQSTGLTLENGYFIRNHEITIDAEL